jgi:uncharacterized protein YeaO (DUF488 family)
MKLFLKRVYEPPAKDDGLRVLVDRLWPRGVKKDEAAVDLWLKDIAPSPELRRWFGHVPRKWQEFSRRYRAELSGKASEIETLRKRVGRARVTLLYGAKDTEHNQAVVLKRFLEEEK